MADLAGSREGAASPPPGSKNYDGTVIRLVARFRAWPLSDRFLLILLVVYIAKQGLFVVAFRPFSGHDEVAHYSYLRTVATEARIPVLPDLAEWRAAIDRGETPVVDQLPTELYRYCRYALDWSFCEDPEWAANPPRIVTYLGDLYPYGYQYAANHPPLYYVLMTPLYWVSADASPEVQHFLLRVAAIPFGLATVGLAFLLARALFPGDRFLAITVPSFVAFQPQISYEAAMVNNDIVAIALYSWILYLVVTGIRDRFPSRRCLQIGILLGLALLTKGTSLTAAGVIGVAIVLAVGWRNVRAWFQRGALVLLPAIVLAAPWYLFLYRTYGNLDGFEQIAALQQIWNHPAGSFIDLLIDPEFIVMRFKETWGEFGWRLIHLSPTLLWAIALPQGAALSGFVLYLFSASSGTETAHDDPVLKPAAWQWMGIAVVCATCIIAYLAVVQFGTRFALTQARYYFPAINSFALVLMLGARTLIPPSLRRFGQGAIFAALFFVNLLIFTQYVIPHYLSV